MANIFESMIKFRADYHIKGKRYFRSNSTGQPIINLWGCEVSLRHATKGSISSGMLELLDIVGRGGL